MKVLIISRGLPNSDYPLNGIFEFNQAKALASIGVEVTYFAIDLRSIRRKRKYGLSSGISCGVRWYVYSIPVGAFPYRLLCNIGKYTLSLLYGRVYTNKQEKPDVIHAHFTDMGYISSFLSQKKGIPLIITEHSSIMNQRVIDPSVLHCATVGYNCASVVVAVSKSLSVSIKTHTGIESIVVPNMIMSDIFSKVRKVNHNGFRIVTTSNLIPLKRTINLVKAVGNLCAKFSITLDVIGDGPLKRDLVSYVKGHDLEKHIKFHGYLPSREMAKLYSFADCFALVSTSETFGVVLVEAMMAGMPVIATKCGGPEDFVNEENGILVDVDDICQLEDAILQIMHRNKAFDSNKIRQQMNIFSPIVVANTILGIYKKVCINGQRLL